MGRIRNIIYAIAMTMHYVQYKSFNMRIILIWIENQFHVRSRSFNNFKHNNFLLSNLIMNAPVEKHKASDY